MGAAFRFIFRSMEEGGPLGLVNASRTPLLPLAETLQDRRILAAVAGWTILNVLLAWGAVGLLDEAAGIAWEAHLGGFYAGLLLYGFFDRPPLLEDNAATAE
jgi:membrane associated rhomboid family serine protease